MCAERVRSDAIEVTGQAADSGKHLHRPNIEIRTLATPGFDDGVDLISDQLVGHIRSLGLRASEIARRRTEPGWRAAVLDERASRHVLRL